VNAAARLGGTLVRRIERISGVPGKYSAPVVAGVTGMLVGGVGEATDIAYHVDFGRDENLLTVPHTMILLGIAAIALAGLLALLLPGPSAPGSLRVRRWSLPPGGLLIVLCSALALAAFPLDGTWHGLFGEDLTLWSPTHLLLIGGPTLSILGLLMLLLQGGSLGRPTRLARIATAALPGFLLLALTDLQAEFGFGVPQFRLLFHPITVAVAAGFTLALARVLLGPLGALKALAAYWILSVPPLVIALAEPDRTFERTPLYLAAALAVELAGLRGWRTPLAFGAVAGLAAGTVGLAAEWALSRVWMPFPWGEALLPEAPLLAAVAGLAAGVLGARVAMALGAARTPEAERADAPAVPRSTAAVAAALAALVLVLALPLPRSGSADRVTVVPFDTRGGQTMLRIRLDPPDAAARAEWLRASVFHGGATDQVDFRPTGPGTYVTERPLTAAGERDVTLRLARGDVLQSVTVYSRDGEHGEPAVALGRRTQRFEAEHALPPVSGFRQDLQVAGYVVVGAIAALWLFALARALSRVEGGPPLPRTPARVGPARRARA